MKKGEEEEMERGKEGGKRGRKRKEMEVKYWDLDKFSKLLKVIGPVGGGALINSSHS